GEAAARVPLTNASFVGRLKSSTLRALTEVNRELWLLLSLPPGRALEFSSRCPPHVAGPLHSAHPVLRLCLRTPPRHPHRPRHRAAGSPRHLLQSCTFFVPCQFPAGCVHMV